MPRISPGLLRSLRRSDPLLAKLLPICRTVEAARNELRWLKERADLVSVSRDDCSLSALVQRRARGEPLQYILGSEYFGNLEIKCRPGVLIPRQETAASVTHLVKKLLTDHRGIFDKQLRVLDLCSGTGCIPLLFHDEFYSATASQDAQLDLLGVDISPLAMRGAEENLMIQRARIRATDHESMRSQSLRHFSFERADVLAKDGTSQATWSIERLLGRLPSSDRHFDILISNPPYISSQHFRTVTASSVRRFEPKLALVPPVGQSGREADGDVFYPRLLQLADIVQAKMVLLEVGDDEQAIRVVRMAALHSGWRSIEIWRDDPQASDVESILIDNTAYDTIGTGNLRSVFAIR